MLPATLHGDIAMLAFLTSQFMLGRYVGLLIGWLVLKRPEWISSGFAWLKAKVFG